MLREEVEGGRQVTGVSRAASGATRLLHLLSELRLSAWRLKLITKNEPQVCFLSVTASSRTYDNDSAQAHCSQGLAVKTLPSTDISSSVLVCHPCGSAAAAATCGGAAVVWSNGLIRPPPRRETICLLIL